MKQIILDWLKTKDNYFYYEKQKDTYDIFSKRFSYLLLSSKVHVDNLASSNSYIIEKRTGIINYIKEFPNHHKYLFKNFNVLRNKYVYDIVKMNEASKILTDKDTVQNRAIIIQLLNELQYSYSRENTFFKKNNKDTYKHIFFDTNKDSVSNFIKDAYGSLKNNSFPFREFQSNYVDKIKEETNNLEEIGIFYPFVFDHDIFENKYFLLEINHLRFRRKNHAFYQNVKNFYENYGLNSDKSKELLTLEDYFFYPGCTYIKTFAYLDPFFCYENYYNQFETFKNYLTLKKINYRDFVFKLFDFLNEVTLGTVKFQHENLINDLQSSRSINRQYSIRELSKIQLEKLEKGEIEMDYFSFNLNKSILLSFINQPKDLKFTKNTTIDDLGYLNYPETLRSNAQLILNDMLFFLNKDDTSKLSYIIDYYKQKIDGVFKNFKLNRECKKIISHMIIEITCFYDSSNNKLSKPYNNTLHNLYTKYHKKDILSIIDFNFQENFIKKYKYEFDKYKPCKIITEDGKEKYMMTH